MRFRNTNLLLTAILLLGTFAAAQTTLGYRQIDLACRVQCSNNPASLLDPWGIAFLPGKNFFVAEHGSGQVDTFNASGVRASGFTVPLPAGSTAALSRPTGIVVDANADIHLGTTHFHWFVATEEGTIVAFNVVSGQFQDVQVLVDRSTTSQFTGLALLHPSCCNTMLAVANFASGEIDVFSPSLTALPGGFDDPNLPAGYSPFNIQTIGDKVFVTYAKKDQSGHAALSGDGLGIVSVFDQEGNFVRRFASEGGNLNAPWGVTQSSANFGPFPSAILIGNTGDGRIQVFDATTAAPLGTLTDSEGFVFTNFGIRALAFRGDLASDGVGDPDDLYFAAESTTASLNDGLFGAIQPGRLTRVRLTTTSPVLVGVETTLTAEVHPLSGGDEATGSVRFIDIPFTGELATVPLSGGFATLQHTFTTPGNHSIFAEYLGTDTLLPSLANRVITVLGPATTTALSVSATTVAAGESVTFTAHTQSAGAIPTGSMTFIDGTNVFAIVDVDADGTASFTTNRLPSGVHAVVAKLLSTEFQGSTSAPINVTVGGDFKLTSNMPAVTISAGGSSDVMLSVNPSNGFTGAVTFSCVAPAAVRCTFTPQVVNVNGQVASAKLTISRTTLARDFNHSGLTLLGMGLFGTMLIGRREIAKKTAMMLVAMFLIGGAVACGGYGKQSTPPQTSMVTVNATSGSISHPTNITVTAR